MATINYFLRGSSEIASIYLRIIDGKQVDIRKKTDFVILKSDWNTKLNAPKLTRTENIELSKKLEDLKTHLLTEYNKEKINRSFIDISWLDNLLSKYFNREKDFSSIYLINYLEEMIKNSSTKIFKAKEIGLSYNTVKNYKTFLQLFKKFELYDKKKVKFVDINKEFSEKFRKWLMIEKSYSVNYSGRQFEFLKTICRDAQASEKEVTSFSINLKTFKESSIDRIIHTLTSEDLEKIKSLSCPTPLLNEVRKWILIGCSIGQRGGDLLQITKSNLRYFKDILMIDLVQEKTKKAVTIPVIDSEVLDILLHEFPIKVSHQRFNKYIKKVCELAEINELVDGYIINKEGRKEKLFLPKYNFITSHSFRRSFATNNYKKVPTAILITITGHSSEQMFLNYINQQQDKDLNAMLFVDYKQNS